MRIDVSVRHEKIAAGMRDYAEKKAQRLVKYYNRIQSVRVVLDTSGAGYLCEMIADLEHMHDLIGRSVAPDPRAAIDEAVDHVSRQLAEHKDRTRHRKGRGPSPHQPTRT